MFDDNPRAEELKNSIGGEALARLSIISQEYSLLQIAKLHDPAIVSGQITLGIDYVIKYGAWEAEIVSKLEGLAEKLTCFAKTLRSARNKALSHNDLAAVLSEATFGEFKKNEDIGYFEALQQFVNVVHEETIGGPWRFDDLVKNDVEAMMAMLKSQ